MLRHTTKYQSCTSKKGPYKSQAIWSQPSHRRTVTPCTILPWPPMVKPSWILREMLKGNAGQEQQPFTSPWPRWVTHQCNETSKAAWFRQTLFASVLVSPLHTQIWGQASAHGFSFTAGFFNTRPWTRIIRIWCVLMKSKRKDQFPRCMPAFFDKHSSFLPRAAVTSNNISAPQAPAPMLGCSRVAAPDPRRAMGGQPQQDPATHHAAQTSALSFLLILGHFFFLSPLFKTGANKMRWDVTAAE